MNVFAHNGFTGNIIAAGTNDTFELTDNGVMTGKFGIENYKLGAGANTLTLTNSQTGTMTGNTGVDVFNATSAQVAGAVKIDGDGGILDILNISTDAGGLNLNTKTANIEIFNLLAGSTSNVFGVNVTRTIDKSFASKKPGYQVLRAKDVFVAIQGTHVVARAGLSLPGEEELITDHHGGRGRRGRAGPDRRPDSAD